MARLYPSPFTGRFDDVATNATWINVSTELIEDSFPIQGNKSKKNRKGNKMADKYILTVKNGEVDYKYNAKTGSYDTKRTDRVEEFDTLAEALGEWLFVIQDSYDHGNNKVSLTFVAKKKK